MYYLRNLRVQLQERRNRLYKTGHVTYDSELNYLLQFTNNNPYLRSILEILDAEANLDFDEWASKHANQRLVVDFPDTEVGRAKVCLGILMRLLNDEQGQEWPRWTRLFTAETQFDPMLRDFTEAVVDPFVNYLHDRIDESGNILYLIERFKLRTEWFDREHLYKLYSENPQTGEAQLDQKLRASLFDGGVDFPLSQPSSPSGKADITAMLETDDPLVVEVKVFDPHTGKNKGHVRQGFHQVLKYANDYNKNVGYLVVFNCSPHSMVIVPDEEAKGEVPSRILYADKTFFVVAIDVNPNAATAIRENPKRRVTISRKDLTGE